MASSPPFPPPFPDDDDKPAEGTGATPTADPFEQNPFEQSFEPNVDPDHFDPAGESPTGEQSETSMEDVMSAFGGALEGSTGSGQDLGPDLGQSSIDALLGATDSASGVAADAPSEQDVHAQTAAAAPTEFAELPDDGNMDADSKALLDAFFGDNNKKKTDKKAQIAPSKRRKGMPAWAQVELELIAEIGTTNISVSKLLKVGRGAVVELDRHVDGPIDLKVAGHLVARGDIEAQDDQLFIRLVEKFD